MSSEKPKYVDVLLPLALPKTLSYFIPPSFSDQISFGIRVEVSLKQKFYSGIIVAMYEGEPENDFPLKPIISIIDKHPVIMQKHFELWKWIATYYMCTVGEVMNAALPAGLKMSSETIVDLLADAEVDEMNLTGDEYVVYEALQIKKSLNLKEIKEILGRNTVYQIINSLFKKSIINVREELIDLFKPRKISLIKIAPEFNDEGNLEDLFKRFSKSKHKTNALLSYFQMTNENDDVLKSRLIGLSETNPAVIGELIKKGIFIEKKENVSRLRFWQDKLSELPVLTEKQQNSVNQIDEIFSSANHVLLHGVTGSGKTRVYQEYISRVIKNGGQVLYLVPEIGLTTQMINRLTGVFGNDVYIFHSKINQNERVEVWNAVYQGKPVILAARSGIFLPFKDLQLIIVDEEHDSSYKQQSPAPHYHARDIAVYLGKKLNIKVILGSATPSLESYLNCQTNKYAYVGLNDRFGEVSLPEIRIIDMRSKSALLPYNSKYSIALVSGIQQTLNNKEQVLLFQNRRGFAPTILCNSCGWNAKCPNCDVSLTYHKSMEELRCHYCGHRKKNIELCPVCNSHNIDHLGYGTEKIESELKQIFPDAKVKRMDIDTVRTKNDLESMMSDIEEGKLDILVGTQMITKGLDFDRIGLVGIIDIDRLMQYPDFRANERAFQLAVQVSGRAGRRNKQGIVIVQTYDPENPLLKNIVESDFFGFAKTELTERMEYRYPPYIRIIELTIIHSKYEKCRDGAYFLAKNLKKEYSDILGPAVPGIARIRGMFHFSIIIKIEKSMGDQAYVKKIIERSIKTVLSASEYKSLKISIDVDPY